MLTKCIKPSHTNILNSGGELTRHNLSTPAPFVSFCNEDDLSSYIKKGKNADSNEIVPHKSFIVSQKISYLNKYFYQNMRLELKLFLQ